MVRSVVGLVPAVGGIVALALIDPWLCATFVAGLPVLLLVLRVFARDASQIATSYLNVQGTIAGASSRRSPERERSPPPAPPSARRSGSLAPLPELHRHGVCVWRAQMRLTAQDVVLIALLEIAVLAVAGVLLARGRISPGELVAAGQYVVLAGGIEGAISGLTRLVHARAGATRVLDILAAAPMRHGTAQAPAGGGRIELRGVTAGAGGRTVLDGLDLVIPAGAFVAVVGRSGSGKSLLAALAGRLVDPDEGEVLLDGIALRELSRTALRREIGYGFERPALLGDTIAAAIAFGTHTPSREEIVAAARAARADDFIRRLPERLRHAPGARRRCPAARSSASGWRARSPTPVGSSCSTTSPRASTPSPSITSAPRSPASSRTTRGSSSPTARRRPRAPTPSSGSRTAACGPTRRTSDSGRTRATARSSRPATSGPARRAMTNGARA